MPCKKLVTKTAVAKRSCCIERRSVIEKRIETEGPLIEIERSFKREPRERELLSSRLSSAVRIGFVLPPKIYVWSRNP